MEKTKKQDAAPVQGNEPQEKRWPDYKETILVRHPQTGEVNAVSDLVQKGNRHEVHTTQPLSKNAPSFYDLKNSGAVAAFIRSFRSQSDNPIDFQFLKVPFNKVSEVVQTLLGLTQNPNDNAGREALSKYYLDTAKLERVKFDHAEIPRTELKELGIDFDTLRPQTQEQLRMGLPVTELVPVTVQVADNITATGLFAPRFYRDHNDALKVALDTPLPKPEYEGEEYNMAFSTQEKAVMGRGGTLERLIQHRDPITGRDEWCYVGLNPQTNRLVFQPKREVPTPSFTYRARISDEGRAELDRGGSAMVEGCHYNKSDNHFDGRISYDIHRGEYVTIPQKYERPYIPAAIREQLSDKEIQALCNYEKVDGEHVKSRNDKSFKGCDLQINRDTNILMYTRREPKQEQKQTQETKQEQSAPQVSRGRKM